MISAFGGKKPRIHKLAFVAPGSHVIGDVSLAKGASVWFGAVLRGDMGKIVVGENSNVQDGAVLHGDHGVGPTLGKGVTLGHQAVVHAAKIGDYSLIGIGARVLTGAKVGKFCLIGAGAVVLEGMKIPDGSLVVGLPAKVVRKLTPKERQGLKTHSTKRYRGFADRYRKVFG